MLIKRREEKQTTIRNKLRSNSKLMMTKKTSVKMLELSLKLDFKKNLKTPSKAMTRKGSADNSPTKQNDLKNFTPSKFTKEDSIMSII